MAELLETYAIEDILIILIIAIAAFVSAWKTWDWIKKKMEETFKPDNTDERLTKLEELGSTHHENINLLIESDKSRIKGEILKQYQYFSRLGYIDMYSWEYLHQQHEIYKKEGGNSFVDEIMEEVDKLNKTDTIKKDGKGGKK